MEPSSRNDIRTLLKTFGIRADEAMVAHIARNPGDAPLRVRLTLADMTDYGDSPPDTPLRLDVVGEIHR